MPRRLHILLRLPYHAAAGLSYLALLACLVLWMLSYCRYDLLTYDRPAKQFNFVNRQGRLKIQRIRYIPRYYYDPSKDFGWFRFYRDDAAPEESLGELPPPPSPKTWTYGRGTRGPNGVTAIPDFDGRHRGKWWTEYYYWGIEYIEYVDVRNPRVGHFTLYLPYYCLTALSALFPALWLCVWYRRRRIRRQLNRPGFPILTATPRKTS